MKSVPAEYYNKKYFFDKYTYNSKARKFLAEGKDNNLPLRLGILKNIKITNGEKVLDLGCGRGEGLVYFIKKGAIAFGIDYSKEAIRISKKNVDTLCGPNKDFLAQANAQNLPFKNETFQIVFLSDVVEHLYPKELDNCLKEVYRVLNKEGLLVLRTAPNKWYYDYGYKVYRILRKVNNKTKLRANPRTSYDYKMHVNEQTYFGLKKTLKKNGFVGKVWLENEIEIKPKGLLKKFVTYLIYQSPLKLFFLGNIYAITKKH